MNGDSGVRKQSQNRLPNIDTISQLGIISKATRCPQSDILLYFSGIYLEFRGELFILIDMKKITVYIKNQEELTEYFLSTEILDHKTIFSKYKIMKDLEDRIVKDLTENQKVQDAYLIDYDTTGDRHCIFDLLDEKILNTEHEFLYGFRTTIS